MDSHGSRLLGDGSFIVKMDGFESYSNIIHIVRSL